MTNKTLRTFLIIILTLIFFNACDIINPPEDIPSYIHIDSITLKTNINEGTSSSVIKDGWVIVGGDFIGTFELPATFPVLKTGDQEVTIRAGIIENGISNTRVPYPFYAPQTINVNLKEGVVDSLPTIVVKYADETIFGWKEDFEDTNNISIKNTSDSFVHYQLTDNPAEVFEGKYSLKATLSKKLDYFEITPKEKYNLELPKGKPVYVEMNFKTDVVATVGYYASDKNKTQTIKVSKIGLNATAEWKKIYINLGKNVNDFPTLSNFKIFVAILKQDDSGPVSIYLDNLKLLYFE